MKAVNLLLAAGAHLVTGEKDSGPLFVTFDSGNEDVFQALLEHGADLNALDKEGHGLLHRAVADENIRFVNALISAGANVNLEDSALLSPLHFVGEGSGVEVLMTLPRHGADFSFEMPGGKTVLHLVAGNPNSLLAEALIDAGADVKAMDHHGQTPLHAACLSKVRGTMHSLLVGGADVNANEGLLRYTPLHLAVNNLLSFDDVTKGIVEHLLRWGADDLALSATRRTPLMCAEDTASHHHLPYETVAPVRGLLMEAEADRVWRRRGWLMLCRARPKRVQLKGNGVAARIRVGPSVRAALIRKVAKIGSGGARDCESRKQQRTTRITDVRLSGIVAMIVRVQEEGVFRSRSIITFWTGDRTLLRREWEASFTRYTCASSSAPTRSSIISR